MEAVRIKLSSSVQGVHKGPEPGGKFFALAWANDLPIWPWTAVGHVDLHAFHKGGGQIYIHNALRNDEWRLVSPEEIKALRFREDFVDDYEGCTTQKKVYPFMPELYLIPTNFRTSRMVRKAENQADRESRPG
jgi:hypothetical protein